MTIRIKDTASALAYLASVEVALPAPVDADGNIKVRRYCGRCGGTGQYPSALHQGICLECGGQPHRMSWVETTSAVAFARKQKTRIADERRKQAKRDAKIAAEQAEAEAKLAALPQAIRDRIEQGGSDFLVDLQHKARRWGLSERQIAAVQRIIDREAQAAAEPEYAPVTAGRRVLRGRLLSIKLKDGLYGQQVKALMAAQGDDGSVQKLWGTLPRSMADAWQHDDAIKVGDEVAIKATVEPSRDDACFGFWSRPVAA